MPVVPAGDLVARATQLLEAAGVSPAKASLVAASLAAANLRAVDSHGVSLLPLYLEQIAHGGLNPQADGHIVSECAACLTYDGENGLGQSIADTCCAHAIRLARDHGLGMVVARNSNHFGAAAFWAQRISAANMIGIVLCNATPIVAPWQGKDPRLGTNPICMSVPGPWLLDMATTTVAANRIHKAKLSGQQVIPEGWAMDSEGIPTTDIDLALQGLPMPLGGYKGSGLAMMVEIFCGVLGGDAMSTAVGGIRIPGRPARTSQTFLAIDLARFLPPDAFASRLGHLIQTVKSAAPAAGFSEVLVAGDPESRAESERRFHGIPIEEAVWEALKRSAAALKCQAFNTQ